MQAHSTAVAQLDAAACCCCVTRFESRGISRHVQGSIIVCAEVAFKHIRRLPFAVLPTAHVANQHRSVLSFVAAGSSSVTRGVPCRFSYIACSTKFLEGIFLIEAYVFRFALSLRLPMGCFLPSRRKPETPARSAPTLYCTPISHARTFLGYPGLRL